MDRSKSERELERCIDSMVDEMNGMYCVELVEEAKLDSKMSDIKLRDDLISQIKEEVRCKKVSERIKAEQQRGVEYSMRVSICGEGIKYDITRNEERNTSPSE